MFVPAKKNRYFICNNTKHLLRNFFSSLICVNFTKRKNNWKKKLFFCLYVRYVSIKIKDRFKLKNFCSFIITQFHSYYLSNWTTYTFILGVYWYNVWYIVLQLFVYIQAGSRWIPEVLYSELRKLRYVVEYKESSEHFYYVSM